MPRWLNALLRRKPRVVSEALWQAMLGRYPFLAHLPPAAQARLRQLTLEFLGQKEFYGAHGFTVTDEMAVAIAAQACLPVLNLAQLGLYKHPLGWYSDFVGIVVHPDAVLAPRETQDGSGVVHRYHEALTGEAMQGGPVTLSWKDVAAAGATAQDGYNVVIHEFAHKIDMCSGPPDGCPPLPAGFMGAHSARAARAAWQGTLKAEFHRFCDIVSMAQHFGGPPTWLDPYAARGIDEFFAVTCEGYFVNRSRFAADFAALVPMYDAFFNADAAPSI